MIRLAHECTACLPHTVGLICVCEQAGKGNRLSAHVRFLYLYPCRFCPLPRRMWDSLSCWLHPVVRSCVGIGAIVAVGAGFDGTRICVMGGMCTACWSFLWRSRACLWFSLSVRMGSPEQRRSSEEEGEEKGSR